MIWYDMIYDMIWYDIFNCNWVEPGGSSTVHIYTHTIHRTTQLIVKSADRALSLRVTPWHLPYNWGKSREKLQSG